MDNVKKPLLRPAIDVLEKEIALRESLDPDYFMALKQDSLEHALKLGISADIMEELLRHD